MNKPTHFQVHKDYALHRPEGSFTLPDVIELVRQAIAFGRDQQIPRLLINTTLLTGYGTLGTLERFQIAETWAKEANSEIIIAVVARPDQIDQERFGLTVARNRGLHAEIFTNEAEACEWLLAQRALS